MSESNERSARLQDAAETFASKSLVDLGRYGVKIEHVQPDRTRGTMGVCFFLSIPKSSDLMLNNNKVAEGDALIKYIKEYIVREYIGSFGESNRYEEFSRYPEAQQLFFDLLEEHKKDVKFLVKTRPEHWTKEKEIESNMLNLSVLMQKRADEVKK